MICPKCGSQNIQAVTVQEIVGGTTVVTETKTKGFGWCKGCIMTCFIGPIGWLCGLCGMGKGKTKTHVVDDKRIVNKIKYCCMDCGNQFET